MDAILVVNAGSSSVKFQVFGLTSQGASRLVRGQLEGIGDRPQLSVQTAEPSRWEERTLEAGEVPDVSAATAIVAAWVRETQSALRLVAFGHRVVHGGPDYDRPVAVDTAVLNDLERFIALAPLHQPNNLAPIRTLMTNRPDLLQIACFDTAFHRGHPEVADHFAIPQYFHAEGVRRYGFHGLSYEYIAASLRRRYPEIASGRVIAAHLGSGASLCALEDCRSIESTMGFTALDGLPMGTRSGQIDPGVLLYWIIQKQMAPADVQRLLYSESGLKGLSGLSNDMRALLSSPEGSARLAVDYFIHRIRLHAGMMAAALCGVDALVFTAGIGERSSAVRERVCEGLQWMGLDLDREANAAHRETISTAASRVRVLVIPTDEEQMIANHVIAALPGSR
jgi:acetate kinase